MDLFTPQGTYGLLGGEFIIRWPPTPTILTSSVPVVVFFFRRRRGGRLSPMPTGLVPRLVRTFASAPLVSRLYEAGKGVGGGRCRRHVELLSASGRGLMLLQGAGDQVGWASWI